MNNTDSATVRKLLLFGEAISDQLKLNYGKVDNNEEKQQFRKILGQIVRKYRIKKQIKKILKGRLWTTKDNFNKKFFLKYARKQNTIWKFFESDLHSRVCPGRKD